MLCVATDSLTVIFHKVVIFIMNFPLLKSRPPIHPLLAVVALVCGQLPTVMFRSLGIPMGVADHLVGLAGSVLFLSAVWAGIRLFQAEATPLVRRVRVALLFAAIATAICLMLSVMSLDLWRESGGTAVLLNPRHMSIPGNAHCLQPDQFVAAHPVGNGQAHYRCGPGFGDLVLWPFETVWTAEKAW